MLLKGCEIVGVFWGARVGKNPERHQASIAELMQMYVDGKIKPHVQATFPLERAGEAITMLAERKAMGKVVVLVG